MDDEPSKETAFVRRSNLPELTGTLHLCLPNEEGSVCGLG
uniref:Uncharacterized protein n=1 Tax=Arundo donax TaxID=35708 RepID=A0A0A9AJQ4_ARUDO